MMRYQWSKLNHLQVGKFAEYFVKMEFTMFGWQVFTSEVDDRGIDFVIREDNGRKNNGVFYEVQVKSLRNGGYIFFSKHTFQPRANLLAAIISPVGW